MTKDLNTSDYCRDVVKNDDPDRYLLTIFAPTKAQPSLWALYSFNQEIAKIRESVSEAMLGEIRLQWWQEVLSELQRDEVREQPIIQELAGIAKNTKIHTLLLELLEARRSDILGEGAADFGAVKRYVQGAGGALSAAAAHIQFGNLSSAGEKVARCLGSAWAMLGLVRALPYQWQIDKGQVGRQFLPTDVSAAMSVPDSDDAYLLLKPTITNMLDFVDEEITVAISLKPELNSGERNLLLLATLCGLYRGALLKSADNPFQMIGHEKSDLGKLWRLFWAQFTGRYH